MTSKRGRDPDRAHSGVHLSPLVLGFLVLVIVLIVVILVLAVAVGSGMAIGATVGVATIASALVFTALLIDQADNPKVMLGMLKVTFCRYSITGSLCVTRQGQILFIDLKSIAANADIGTVAVEGLMAQRDVVLSAATVIVAPAARTPNVWSLSHSAITSPTLRFARPRPAWRSIERPPGDRRA
jgi:hypothetical protein